MSDSVTDPELGPEEALDRFGPLVCRRTESGARRKVHIPAADCHRQPPEDRRLPITHRGQIPLRAGLCAHCREWVRRHD